MCINIDIYQSLLILTELLQHNLINVSYLTACYLGLSTSVLKALPGKLDIKRHSPSILYISASLAMSTSVLKALPGKLDIKRHSPSILYVSANLTMSTSVLKALPCKLDIKRHSSSILYIWASLAMSTSVLKALPGKLDIKRHSPSILYVYFSQIAELCSLIDVRIYFSSNNFRSIGNIFTKFCIYAFMLTRSRL